MRVRILVAALLLLGAADAGAVSLRVKNCTGVPVSIRSYNSDDPVLAVEYSKAENIGPSASATVSCATSACALKVRFANELEGWNRDSYLVGFDVCTIGTGSEPLRAMTDFVCGC